MKGMFEITSDNCVTLASTTTAFVPLMQISWCCALVHHWEKISRGPGQHLGL